MPNIWPNCAGLPPGAAAALAALHLGEPRPELLKRLDEREALDALAYCDRSQLSLPLHLVVPAFLSDEMNARAAKNVVRLRGLESLYDAIGKVLAAPAALDFVALKGITQCALSGMRLEDRVQHDVDLYLPRPSAETARDRFVAEGYEPLEGMESFPTDHLPALVRRGKWQWRGDFFDPDMPLAVELHFQFWNPALERLPAPGVDEFWTRRVTHTVGGIHLPVLFPPDALAYAALHLIRHVLRGTTRPFHVYELARCLEQQAADGTFWDEWRKLHAPELRRLQAVAFRLAESWFGCAMAPAAREEIDRLPAATQTWFSEFAASPATSDFLPNKDELWLHLSLLDSAIDRYQVARRRMLPGNLPPPAAAGHSASAKQRRIEYARHVAGRLRHHTISLFTTLASGARWWWRTNSFGSQFWVFLTAAVIFNFALFIFFLLYSLFLTDAGFDVRFVGAMNSASRVGSMAGAIPAAYFAHRVGLRAALVGAIAATALLTLARAFAVAGTPVVVLAFVASMVFSLWAVVIAPSIAAAVDEKRRTTAFSVFFAVTIGTGIAGNWIAGQLPGWLHGKQPALILAAVVCALAMVPAMRLKPAPIAAPGEHIYPRGPFLWRFLAPFAIWHLATGVFNPFNNVYMSRLNFSVAEIGSIFSVAQLVQVGAVLLAPLVLRRFGLVTGIVYMMGGTALALGGLASQSVGAYAVLAYVAYMSAQWMSEPGLNTMLMNQVGERERSGASAMSFLVAFSAQAVAAFAGGALFAEFGFGPVLLGAAVAAAGAAVMFKRLLA